MEHPFVEGHGKRLGGSVIHGPAGRNHRPHAYAYELGRHVGSNSMVVMTLIWFS